MHTIRSWCRANAMLVISLLAAAATAFFVPPDSAYLGYYDLKTLSCLFSVLAVVGALRDLDVFSALSQRMVHTFSTVRGVCTALVVITMFGSMLLTNDTALLTFLPLGWFVLSVTGQEKHAALLFILQNCAANLCGMITPFGNPQNLYLFSYYGIPAGTFFSVMLPPFILSTVLILLCCLLFPKDRLTVPEAQVIVDRRRAAVYRRALLSGRRYGAAADPLRSRSGRHRSGALVSGPACPEVRGLGASGHLCRFLHLFGQPCPDGACPDAVCPALIPRTMLISALTCQIISNVPGRDPPKPFHAGCPRPSGRRQHWRRRNAGGLSGQPHHLPGIHPPRSRRHQALSHPLFRHQLRFSDSSSGCHVLSGLSSRGLSAEKQDSYRK